MKKRNLISKIKIQWCFIVAGLVLGSQILWAETQPVKVQTRTQQNQQSQQTTSSQGEDWKALDPTLANDPSGPAWDPYQELDRMHSAMNRIFERSMERANRAFSQLESPIANPRMDIREEAGQFVVSVDVPGMERDKLQISATNEMLTISGERKTESETTDHKAGMIQKERRVGAFQRSIPMPANVDTDKITAKYDLGVLTIDLPKKNPEQVKESVKKITVQ